MQVAEVQVSAGPRWALQYAQLVAALLSWDVVLSGSGWVELLGKLLLLFWDSRDNGEAMQGSL